MRGLTVIMLTADADRFAGAMALASANAALGGRTRLYCHDAAVMLLEPSAAMDAAIEIGVTIIACQSGLAAHGRPLPDFAEGGGLVSLLATLGDDRLLSV